MKPLVIFDLDGTLVDTPSGIVSAFVTALRDLEMPFEDRRAIRATIGLPLEKAFGQILALPVEDERVTAAVRQYQAVFREQVLPQAPGLVFPGVVEGLALLKGQGYTLAIATSKIFASAKALLEAAGLWSYFDLVLGADMVAHPKPHPEMGLLAMSRLGADAATTAMVGDTTHDLLMAKQAGMAAIGVTWGIHTTDQLKAAEPQVIVDTFSEVVGAAHALLKLSSSPVSYC
ncbi:HAD family hydrolase [Dickeya dadantii subsp. dieffenbachiae]|uniref:HAD family hydrolase n=1 Tax=Dickeya dadantii TaxID=204038 RepID=UPI0005774E4C|nr:HAD family hydrolase [Dickeya dadantii]MCA7011858.1 HAD family hydrolase [Dickeya dadantii]QWT42880.1 HAD family hydrolase [Dickeya dadantii]